MKKKSNVNQIQPEEQAYLLIQSGLCEKDPDPYRVLTKIMIGKEIGLEPVQSVSNIEIIGDKICIQATILESLILKAGHNIEVEYPDSEKCNLNCFKKNTLVGVVECRVSQIGFRGLVRKQHWNSRTGDLLYSRAVGIACRKYYLDLFLMEVFTPEDILVDQAIADDLSENSSPDGTEQLMLNFEVSNLDPQLPIVSSGN